MMEAAIVLVVLAVIAFVAYKKVGSFRAKVDAVLPKAEAAVLPQSTNVPPASANEILAAIDFLEPRIGTVTIQDLMKKLGRGMSPEEIAYAQSQGVYVAPKPADPGPGVDRSGFELTFANGYLVHPVVVSGRDYIFTYPVGVGKTILVFGVGGDQITVVNDRSVNGQDSFPATDGRIVLNVQGVGREPGKLRVGVQLVP